MSHHAMSENAMSQHAPCASRYFGSVASGNRGKYHRKTMPTPRPGRWLALLGLLFVTFSPAVRPADNPQTIPVSDIKPGMKGVVYTIFEGDQVEKVDLEVI
jgi:hypothetical protein